MDLCHYVFHYNFKWLTTISRQLISNSDQNERVSGSLCYALFHNKLIGMVMKKFEANK